MAPVGAILALTLLALGGVDAKKKNKIAYSYYAGPDCNGHPIDGDLFDLTFKDKKGPSESECTSLTAGGIRLHKHWKNKYNDWVNKVYNGEWNCGVRLYQDHGCSREHLIADLSVPNDMESCHPLPANKFSSVQFWCGINSGPHGRAVKTQASLPVTTNSTAANRQAHPSMPASALNTTSHSHEYENYVPGNHKVPRDVHHLAADVESTNKMPPQPRADHNVIYTWKKHPWTGSDICFKCWTDHKNINSKFGCHSKPRLHGEVNCGPKPLPVPPTSTHLVTHTTTAEVVFTVTDQFHQKPSPVLENRSWHTPVALQHPYFSDKRICADAEWEERGESEEEVQIKHPKDLNKCRRKNMVNIDIGAPEKIVESAITETVWTTPTMMPQMYATTIGVPVVMTGQSVYQETQWVGSESTSTIQTTTVVTNPVAIPVATTTHFEYTVLSPAVVTVSTEIPWPPHPYWMEHDHPRGPPISHS